MALEGRKALRARTQTETSVARFRVLLALNTNWAQLGLNRITLATSTGEASSILNPGLPQTLHGSRKRKTEPDEIQTRAASCQRLGLGVLATFLARSCPLRWPSFKGRPF